MSATKDEKNPGAGGVQLLQEVTIMKKMNKAQARKAWNNGKSFWITACNMKPECGLLIDLMRIAAEFSGDFDKMVNAFIYYNCNNECGRYPAYYID